MNEAEKSLLAIKIYVCMSVCELFSEENAARRVVEFGKEGKCMTEVIQLGSNYLKKILDFGSLFFMLFLTVLQWYLFINKRDTLTIFSWT